MEAQMEDTKMLTRLLVSKLFGLLVVGVLSCGVGMAQIKSGVITGIVTDTNRAVIPGATISVVSEETNVAVNTVSSDSGGFTVPYLAPGKYTLNVEKPGSGF